MEGKLKLYGFNNLTKSLSFNIFGLTHSSIKGPAGNIEYLVWFGTGESEFVPDVISVVTEAHAQLN